MVGLAQKEATMGLPAVSLSRSKQSRRSKKTPSTKSSSVGCVESSVSTSTNAIDGDHATGHGYSSVDTHRRGGTRWSASMKDVADQLHSLRHSEPRNLKSCMKVATLQESLDNIEDEQCKKAGENENPRHKKPHGVDNRLLLLQPMKSMRTNLTRKVSSKKGTELLLLDAATEDDTHLPATTRPSLRNVLSGLGRVSRRNIGSKGDYDIPKRMPAQDGAETGADAVINEDRETKVNFTKLHFRQYTIRAGSNPGVSRGGAAIELGWQYEDTPPQSIHEYEEAREPRKELKEMKLSRAERERRLLDSGVSLKEIQKSTKRVNQAKAQRKQTLEDMGRMRQEYKKELLRDRFRRFFRLEKSESLREDELWDEANRETLAS